MNTLTLLQPRETSFKRLVFEALSRLGEVEIRPHFAGEGLYYQDRLFAIMRDCRLYLRADSVTALRFQAEGMQPFRPAPGVMMSSFYEAPERVVLRPDRLEAWARRSAAL